MPSDSHPTKHIVGWADITNAVDAIAHATLEVDYEPKRILAIARGGLIPAVMLSHILDVREIYSMQLISYTGEASPHPLQPVDYDSYAVSEDLWNQEDTLIIDDLLDTGATQAFLREWFPNAIRATLFHKKKTVEGSEFNLLPYPGGILPDKWIVFPWEQG